jgi:hypothetical protein
MPPTHSTNPQKTGDAIESLKRYLYAVACAEFGNQHTYTGPAGPVPASFEFFPLLDQIIAFVHARQLPIDTKALRTFSEVETRRLFGSTTGQGVVASGIVPFAGQKVTPGEWLGAARALDDTLNDIKGRLSTPGTGKKLSVSERLTIDVPSRIVTLDGTTYAVADLKTLLIYQAIAEAPNPPITNGDIQQVVRGVKGHRVIAERIKTLPDALQATIETSTAGHSLIFPRKGTS